MIHRKGLDINEEITGRFHTHPVTGKKSPIIGTAFQNGLNYKKNGVFLPVNTTVFAQNDYEFTHKVDKARAILRFGDSSSNAKKHLFGIEDDDGNWLNVKLDRAGHDMSGTPGNKPTFPHTDGLIVEHIPKYNGIKTNYRLGSSGINEIKVTFKYNQELTPEQRGNTIVFIRDGKDIFIIKAPFAYDDGKDIDHIEPVIMKLDEGGGFVYATLTVNSLWVAGAIDAVIDPDVTLGGVGVIEDALLHAGVPDTNFGGSDSWRVQGGVRNAVMKVDLSSLPAGAVPVNSHFGVDVYDNTVVGKVITWYEVLVSWVEGTATGTVQAGSCSWNSREHGIAVFHTAGCRGAGTDRNSVADGSKVAVISSDFQMPITNTLAQIGIDAGLLSINIDDTGSTSGRTSMRSTETILGIPPYYYIEYTAGPTFNPAWARNSNLVIGSGVL